MERLKKTIKKDLYTITKTGKTLKDVYNVIFSHGSNIAYETLVNNKIETVTYAAQDLEIRAFAAYIRQTYPGINGGYIGIDLNNSPGFLTAFWGILISGNKPYLVNSFYPPELKVRLLKRLDAKIVVTGAGGYADFTVIDIGVYDKTCPKITDGFWQNEFALSSALTGLEAKICVFDGGAVVNQILNTKGVLKTNNWLMNGYKKTIKVAMILPLFHIFGIMAGYFWFAFFGRTAVFLKDGSPDTVRAAVNSHKATHIFAPPILFHKLHKGIMNGVSQESERRQRKFQKGIRLAFALQNVFPALGVFVSKRLFRDALAASFGTSPRFMISGGAHIDGEALKFLNCVGYPLFNGYGATETGISGANFAKRISVRIDGSIGKPFKNTSYSYGADGTLAVSGGAICKRIITADGAESSVTKIETNDLVRTANGRLFIVGRKSDLYIGENGENISPDTIQNGLKVKNANRLCVLELNGRLSIVLEYDEKLPDAVIASEIGHIKTDLAKIPRGRNVQDIFVTRQPIASPNAIKVSRALLRQKIARGEVVLTDYKKPCGDGGKVQADGTDDETMALIKKTFAKAADANAAVQPSSDFFIDLGGTSLDYIMLASELESVFDIKINLETNQNLRTPEHFYKYIKGALL